MRARLNYLVLTAVVASGCSTPSRLPAPSVPSVPNFLTPVVESGPAVRSDSEVKSAIQPPNPGAMVAGHFATDRSSAEDATSPRERAAAERLATETVPEGIRPQMTPQASIMGQILHVGVHRRTGPQGGDLAAIGQTGLLAERTMAGDQPNLTVWRPRERNRPEAWERVAVENPVWAERTVTFAFGGRSHAVTFRTPLEVRKDLRSTTDWLIRPRLLKLPGLGNVADFEGTVTGEIDGKPSSGDFKE